MSDGADAGLDGNLVRLCDQLGLRLDAGQRQALLHYLALLQRWNGTHNLTAVRTPEGMWSQHLADCLALIGPLQARCEQGRVLDVGSGGGLPGVVIAACLPALQVVCVDTVGKKAAFVRQAAGELGLRNLSAVHSRVEAMTDAMTGAAGGFDIITSRAFASLADFAALTRKQLAPAGLWVAMKGQQPDGERAALPADIDVFHVEQLQVPGLNAQRCLVWMRPRQAARSESTSARN